MIKDRSNGNIAVNSYNLYKEDVKMVKKMGMDAYRFSISWPRILPGGKLSHGVNQEGINYYNNLIDELLANGIQPYVTLFHWDLPQALEDEYKGFLSPQIVEDFKEYVELCFWEFGDRVKHWITLNEPWSFSVNGHVLASAPPGRGATSVQQIRACPLVHKVYCTPPQTVSEGDPGREPYLSAHYQLLAHAAAVELYRTKFQKAQHGEIGITLVSKWFEPLDESSKSDHEAALRSLDFMFGWFMEPITSGDYPATMKRIVGDRLPKFSADDSKKLKGSFDFLGLNYYTTIYATNEPPTPTDPINYNTDIHVKTSYERNGVPIGPKAGSDWLYIVPWGIRKLLTYTKKNYNDPRIVITENGVDEVNDTTLTLSKARQDNIRIEYIQNHLFNVRQAIHDDGVNVKGYFVWSLMDNFEWTAGFTVRFGLIHVDYNDNFARYPKESATWFIKAFHKDHCKHPLLVKKKAGEELEEQISNKRQRIVFHLE